MSEYKSKYLDTALADIRHEREYQQKRWGDDFDKKNTPNDWLAYIGGYLGRALTMPWDPAAFRIGLVKVATLCVAAIEWCDRTKGKMPKRHYDT